MSRPEDSGVNPLRLPMALRRLAAIKKYLKLSNPTQQDTKEIAQSVGLSRSYFQTLVNAWLAHQDISLLVPKTDQKKGRGVRLNPRVYEILDEEVRNPVHHFHGPSITAQIQLRCKGEGLPAPSSGLIAGRIRKAKAENPEANNPAPRIVVGRAWVKLPTRSIQGDEITAHPAVLLAVALPEGVVLNWRMALNDEQSPSMRDFVIDLVGGETLGALERPLWMQGVDIRAAGDTMTEVGLENLREYPLSVQNELVRCFNEKLGSLRVYFRARYKSNDASKILKWEDEPVSRDTAFGVIGKAIASHNASRGGDYPAYRIKR